MGGEFKHLRSGRRYEVVREFVDFDGRVHTVGERWVFLRSTFLPYDDGLTLVVQPDGGSLWQVRMQWRDEEQGPVIDMLEEYVRAVVE